jgi:hypothetical protein
VSIKKSIAVMSFMCFVLFGVQQAFGVGLPCSELKTKIEDGLKEKGVQNFTLTIVPTVDAADGKVVGSCDGGTNKIVYSRAASTEPAKAKAASPAEKKPTPAK